MSMGVHRNYKERLSPFSRICENEGASFHLNCMLNIYLGGQRNVRYYYIILAKLVKR